MVNPFAYEARARVAPLHIDGLNLARIFPGDANGSPSRILAHQLLDLVLRNLGPDDLFFDFHSGSADVAFAQLVGYRDVPGEATIRAAEAARFFGIDQIWRIPDSPGPFNAETARRGIPTLGTEITGRAGCDPEDVGVYERGLRNLLAYLDIVPAWPSPSRIDRPERTTIEISRPQRDSSRWSTDSTITFPRAICSAGCSICLEKRSRRSALPPLDHSGRCAPCPRSEPASCSFTLRSNSSVVRHPDRHRRSRRGSVRSRSPSPVKFSANTSNTMASPGNIESHGASRMYPRLAAISAPHEAVGG